MRRHKTFIKLNTKKAGWPAAKGGG